MNWWRPFRYWVGALGSKRRLEQEMVDEMREHIEERAERYIESGMSADEARNAAKRDFGGVDQLKEQCRDQRGWFWLEQLAKDLRLTIRSLAKARGFSLTVMGTLALGIGSAAAIFRAVDWVLFRANVFPTGLYLIGSTDKSGQLNTSCIDAQVRVYRELGSVFREHGLAASRQVNISIAGSPVGTHSLDISTNFLPMLGIVPALGRGFLPGEDVDGRNQVVVISHNFWQSHFAGSPDVLGQKIIVGGKACTVVGVLRDDQSLPPGLWTEVFRPLAYKVNPAAPWDPMLMVLVRLHPGVKREKAEAVMARGKIEWPAHWDSYASEQKPTLTSLSELLKQNHPEVYWMLCGAVGFLYSIACINATSLLLVRQLGRKRELSVRLALGGGRWCIIRLLLLESVFLCVISSAAGFVVANWLSVLFAALGGEGLQVNWLRWSAMVGIDWRTFAVLASVTVLTSVAIVVVPAAGLRRLDIQTGLKDGGGGIGESRRFARLRGGLVVMQVAFAIILLTGAGLLVRTFQKLQDVPLGFETDQRVKVWIDFPAGYVTGNEARLALLQRLQDRLRRVPGVVDVAFGSDNLMPGRFSPLTSMQLPDGTLAKVENGTFSGNYREVTGVVLKRGQWLNEASKSEVMINEAFAKRCFGAKDPVGQPIRFADAPKQWKGWTVVGVVGDMRETVRTAPGYHMFSPPGWAPWSVSSFILRFGNDLALSSEIPIRRAIYQFDPEIMILEVIPLAETRYLGMDSERFALTVLKVLSVIALFLTVVGFFSVLAYTVDRRMNEFGVRLALGAQPKDLHRLVMKRGLMAATSGVLFGIVGALALTQFMQSLLFDTVPYDPLVYAAVALILLLAAVAACWLPARRAGRVDITRLLRAE